MSEILLTAYDGAILGPIAKLLGWIMNGIYMIMYKLFGTENIGISIFLLTILIYTCLLPLTYKQQKFSKLNQKMQPELEAIKKKYGDKKDQASMTAMQQETQLIYAKYGVSPMGSCLQLLIQMPILFALYRVFYNIPAYIISVKEQYSSLVDGIVSTDGFVDKIGSIISDYSIITSSGINSNNLDKISEATGSTLTNYIVDVLYKVPSNAWEHLSEYFPNLTDEISSTVAHVQNFNYIFNFGSFQGLNISDTPWSIIKLNFASGNYIFVILAALIPTISFLSQYLSTKLMPQAGDGNDQMARQMKTMNIMMPLFSFIICFSVPVGLGIYWIFTAVYRCVQQIIMNRHFEKIDVERLIEKNQEKVKKKREKQGIYEERLRQAAQINTRSIESKAKVSTSEEKELQLEKAKEVKANAKKGSLASKANMVKEYNERNSHK